MNVFIGVGVALGVVAVVVPCFFVIGHCLFMKERERAWNERELSEREKEIKECTIVQTVKKKKKKRISRLRGHLPLHLHHLNHHNNNSNNNESKSNNNNKNKRWGDKDKDKDESNMVRSTISIDTNASGSANSCHICLEDFKPGDIVCSSKYSDRCNHIFHEYCMNRWLLSGTRNDCPVCRNIFLVPDEEENAEDGADGANHNATSNDVDIETNVTSSPMSQRSTSSLYMLSRGRSSTMR